ncbi:MAG: NAD(P)H-dependent oxidoreductase [Gammaproteobacteria bacterium]
MVSGAGANAGKVLVVYYSMSGNTARVARDIARLMGADVESIRDEGHGTGFVGYLKCAFDAMRGKAASIGSLSTDPQDYALTIIGTPVWFGRMTPGVRAFLNRCRSRLGDVAYFTTSGSTEVMKLVPQLQRVSGRIALAAVGFDARDLADAALYDTKLAVFVAAINRSRPLPRVDSNPTA